MPETTFIYALCEPGTRTIRYIGKAHDPQHRLRKHLCRSIKGKNHLGAWLSKLKIQNQIPDLLILKSVPTSEWEWWERSYIRNAKVLGFDLTNGTEGGDGVNKGIVRGPCPEATKEKIRIKALGNQRRLGMKNSPDHLRKLAEGARKYHTGRKQSPETISRRIAKCIGKKRTPEQKFRMSQAAIARENRKRGLLCSS